MKWAEANSVPIDNYKVELTYNEAKNTLCFRFKFLTGKNENQESFKIVEFNWQDGLKVAEYSSMGITVY